MNDTDSKKKEIKFTEDMEFCFTNSGIEEKVIFTEREINTTLLPLIHKLEQLQRENGKRILVMLAAPPGCGKTTYAEFLKRLAELSGSEASFTVIGMDGFHRYQEYLLTHTTVRDGQEIPLVKIKGAPITFDLDLLTQRVARVAEGEVCGWPIYDRMLHNPVDNKITVSGDIIILEGNYLLLDREGWRNLRNYADYTIKMTADPDLLRERLVRRKISSGLKTRQAEEFVDFSDMANVRVCLQETGDADLTVQIGS